MHARELREIVGKMRGQEDVDVCYPFCDKPISMREGRSEVTVGSNTREG